jgi:hypothetical protein
MGAIASFAVLQAALTNGVRSDMFMFQNGNIGLVLGTWLSSYARYMPGALAPTLPETLNSSSVGAVIAVPLTSSKQLWLCEAEFAGYSAATPGTKFCAMLYDRLSHMGGLNSTLATEQTTNFPTAPLTRYTTGEGVIPFLEVYGVMGTINSTATIKYTNQDGVAGKISQPVSIVTNINNSPDALTAFMLADGDTGCRSVESFTLAAGSVSNVNIGITLMKKICHLPVDTGSYAERQGYRQMLFHGGITEILPGAFLQLVWYPSSSGTGNWNLSGRVGIVEA